jgi:NADH:ubiquinone oxidoreductase subunit H
MLNFSWKVLIPISVLNLVITAFFVIVGVHS